MLTIRPVHERGVSVSGSSPGSDSWSPRSAHLCQSLPNSSKVARSEAAALLRVNHMA